MSGAQIAPLLQVSPKPLAKKMTVQRMIVEISLHEVPHMGDISKHAS